MWSKPLCEITARDLERYRERELNAYLWSLDRDQGSEEYEEKGGDDE